MPRTPMIVTISLLLAMPTVRTQENTSTQAVAQEGTSYVHVPTTIAIGKMSTFLRQHLDG